MFPGAAVGIICDGKTSFITAGAITYEENAPLVQPETVYDVASLTKSVPIALLALQLIEAGKLALDESVPQYLPEYVAPGGADIKIRHLLTYTVIGFPFSKYASDAKALRKRILSEPLRGIPGSEYLYTNFPAYLLGRVIQRLAGEPLDTLADKKLFKPLGMSRTSFHAATIAELAEIAPTEIVGDRALHGIVHDESARTLSADGETTGHAGLFSCVRDMLRPVEALVHDGSFNNVAILKPSTIALLSEDQVPEVEDRVTFGFELERSWMATGIPSGVFGKTGFTGCSLVVWPKQQVGWVLLSNHVHPHRPNSRDAINGVRRQLGDVVLAHATS